MGAARTQRSPPDRPSVLRYRCRMAPDNRDISDELTPRERARLRARDRKRTTPMVVDNAAVKRTALALAQRRATGSTPPAKDGGPD
jgi:hypothetical protein